jgi:hypothetical protein
MNLIVRAADRCGEFYEQSCASRTEAFALRDDRQRAWPRAAVDVIDLDRVDVDCNGITLEDDEL